MPKVSDAHRNRRRQQILDGARACFARRGFEQTTVRELEAETRLSSGAIFSYYPSKLDLFIALATRDAERMAQLWREGGMGGLVTAVHAEASQLSASYLELDRRLWSDVVFRAKWQDRGAPLTDAVDATVATAARTGHARTDISPDALSAFALVVLDGLLLRIRIGMLPEQLTEVIDLYEQTIRGDTTAPPGPDTQDLREQRSP